MHRLPSNTEALVELAELLLLPDEPERLLLSHLALVLDLELLGLTLLDPPLIIVVLLSSTNSICSPNCPGLRK